MSDPSPLERLAELAGIELAYLDIWAREHRASDDTKRRLLAALGIPAGDAEEVAASIEDLETKPWRRPLPHVMVVGAGKAIDVTVSLPATFIDRLLACTLLEEAGAAHYFDFAPATAPLIDQRVVDGQPMEQRQLRLPVRLPLGYHSLRFDDIGASPLRLIVAPERCYLPPGLTGDGRRWGLAAHLYSLRSEHDWGIGDFTDLGELVDMAGRLGASAVGVNPLHALFPNSPESASPYSPSSRLFLNPIYVDPVRVPEFACSAEAQAVMARAADDLAAARSAPFVDYSTASMLKRRVLEALYACFRARTAPLGHRSDESDFARFREAGGERLHLFAIFETLSERFPDTPWPAWPTAYRDPLSSDVMVFAQVNHDRVRFHEYVQWVADRQLAAAGGRTADAGLDIGLYCDLAVGVDPNGADAWIDQCVVVTRASVGAPPDPFNMLGQDWGTPPLDPRALRERAYEPFVAMLRANMRHAGALRIDHAMGLLHLFWIPLGEPASAGAYLRYPFDDLLGVVALESHRNRCMVIGEDLGTVPDGFRQRMAAAQVLSYRVLYFEKDDAGFKRPGDYPSLALACVSTHDLATIAGFWSASDIDLRWRLGLYPSTAAEVDERSNRETDRSQLLSALADENLLPRGIKSDDVGVPSVDLIVALHQFLGRSPAKLVMVQLDDLTTEAEQLNLPGTVDERPNWRRRLSVDLSQLESMEIVRRLRTAMAGRETVPAWPDRPEAVP
jgi:4-alpha-glucanotransferase